MRIVTPVLCLIGALALSACTPSTPSSEPTPVDATAVTAAPAAPATVAAPAPVATPTTGIWLEPAGLSACGTADKVVKINWDVSADPSITEVKIVLPTKDAQGKDTEGLFARTVPVGSKDSGPWMAAGSLVILRNAADDAELARATVESIPCP